MPREDFWYLSNVKAGRITSIAAALRRHRLPLSGCGSEVAGAGADAQASPPGSLLVKGGWFGGRAHEGESTPSAASSVPVCRAAAT